MQELVRVEEEAAGVVAAAEAAWRELREVSVRFGWPCAMLLLQVRDTEAWRAVGFPTFAAWCESIHLTLPTASRLVDAARRVRELPADDAERWTSLGVWDVAELRRLERRGQAVGDLVEAGVSGVALRREIARRLAEVEHLDTEVRTVSITIPASVRDLWAQALNVVRFFAGARDPSPAELFEGMVAEILSLPLPEKWEKRRFDVLDGKVRCAVCGSWNVADLDSHHVLPRSHGGHDGPVVLLCRSCHDEWQPRWRELADRLGFAEEAAAP